MRNMNMNMDTAMKLMEVGKVFRIPGPFFSYEEIKMGNVNHSYKVDYVLDDGTGMAKIKSYLVQKINTVAFTKPVELMSNIDKVTSYIRENNPDRISLHFHHTADGTNYHMDKDGFWRLSNYVDSVTYNSGNDIKIVRNAGEAFGDFQLLLKDFDAEQLYFTIPDFHNTRKRYADFKESVRQDRVGRAAEARELIDWLLSVEDKACTLTDMFDRGELPLRVTHNDTKINNVLFDKTDSKPLIVIDLDTVMPGLVGHDFGDAIRFAANFTEEDSTEPDKIGVDLNTFWAFAEGFIGTMAATLTREEAETLGLSCFCITTELTTRFLSDYLNGDVYFKIRSEKHNLIRARAQAALAKDMLLKEDAMTQICLGCYEKYRR